MRYTTVKMIFLIVVSVVVSIATSQYQSSYASQPQSTAGKLLYPAAPLHYVNIGPQLAGDYKFGYNTGKGPMGQSFREEMRLADGSVKGTYGVIDEFGQKRVVHYTAGKGGFIAEEDSSTSNSPSPVSSLQRQSKPTLPQNFDTTFSPREFHFPVFKPSNYLRSSGVSPIYETDNPVQPEKPENRLPTVDKLDKHTTPFYNRLSTPVRTMNSAVPIYSSSAPVEAQKVAIPEVQSYEISQKQDKNIEPQLKVRNSELRRVTKKPNTPAKLQRVQKKTVAGEQLYDPKIEDDYYDSAPAFIDIERLSYSIGSDRSSDSV